MTHKDANECLQAGVAREAMQRALDTARDFAPEKILAAGDLEEEYIKWVFDHEIDAGVELPFGFPMLRFRRRETTVWTGIEKSGKTTVLSFATVAALQQGERALIASFEMPWQDTNDKLCSQATGGLCGRRLIKRLLKKCTTDEQRVAASQSVDVESRAAHRWLAPNLWYYAHVGIGNWRQLMEDIRWARHRLGITWVVIDNFMRLGIAKDDYAQQADAIIALVALCMEVGIHLHVVVHQNASEGTKGSPGGKRTISGAHEIKGNPHNIVEVQRNDKKALQLSELWDKRKLGMIGDSEFATEKSALDAKEDGKFILRAQRNGDTNDASKMLWFLWESQQYADVPLGHADHAPIRFVAKAAEQARQNELPSNEEMGL